MEIVLFVILCMRNFYFAYLWVVELIENIVINRNFCSHNRTKIKV